MKPELHSAVIICREDFLNIIIEKERNRDKFAIIVGIIIGFLISILTDGFFAYSTSSNFLRMSESGVPVKSIAILNNHMKQQSTSHVSDI